MSLIASGALTGIMGMRFYNSGKFMPAGLVAGARLLREARLEITGALTQIFVYSLATGEVPKDCLLMLGRLGLKMFEKPHKS
ncbi:transmembrane protein 14C-like isoform X2 [Chiloscyllium plagiosum]|uniref:transmembrane protein 14C-like isoform X2 n=1 Tax=Chiloscyllium plagiosum TaxID=36176 RepID=UPI001CB8807E|nr:transmembrane protein 14C-like isoform X2 [Chiloscyllium plagiosum]